MSKSEECAKEFEKMLEKYNCKVVMIMALNSDGKSSWHLDFQEND